MTSAKFHAFCEWLANTPPSMLIQNVSWIIPGTQTIHILSIAVLMSAVAMVDFRVLGVAMRSQPPAGLARRLLPFAWAALPVLLITGSILMVGEPARSLESVAFQVKMALLAAVIAVTLAVQAAIRNERAGKAKLLAVVSLALWVTIIFAGRYIAYMPSDS